MKKSLAILLILATVIASMYCVVYEAFKHAQIHTTEGSSSSGVTAILATSSTVVVGPGTNHTILFPENVSCSSRVISTVGQPIMLSFASVQTGIATSTGYPNGVFGFQQAASTTVAYDSGIYGCPAVSAYGYSASSTITIAEFR